jgi:hypothetical protein
MELLKEISKMDEEGDTSLAIDKAMHLNSNFKPERVRKTSNPRIP